jgi:hypothetical protein
MADSIIVQPSTRSRTSRCAHVIERIGLSMAGASCGLFVAAHVSNARVEALGSVGLVLFLTLLGAIGFYLGIDVPPHRSGRVHMAPNGEPAVPTDPVELLSSAGTFLTALTALISVYFIVADADSDATLTVALAVAWLLGACMQIVAGFTARARRTG